MSVTLYGVLYVAFIVNIRYQKITMNFDQQQKGNIEKNSALSRGSSKKIL